MKIEIFLGLIFILLCFRRSFQINCKDEGGNDIDWYVNYKLPKIESERRGTLLGDGEAYAFITAPGSTSTWKLSSKNISSGSMLEKTLEDFYLNKQSLTYLMYNDQAPVRDARTAAGHLKGILAFNSTIGFWLVHSIPNFADTTAFHYPENALINGQSILCVTFRTAELNEICNQLLYSHPNIYAKRLTTDVKSSLDSKAQSLFTNNPDYIRKSPYNRTTFLKSLANKSFISFAKDNQYRVDLYSGIMAPKLGSSLAVETWQRGSGGTLDPSCQSDYFVLDVKSINMTASVNRRNNRRISFKSSEDHSKWAVSQSNKSWICIGDLNRMASQGKRGGGAICFISKNVQKAFQSIIAGTDDCPI